MALFFLVCAHFSVKAFFPHPIFWLAGAGAIVAVGSWFVLSRKDVLGFFLAVFACAHFAFADNQGGLWSYVVCAVPLIAMLLKFRRPLFRIASVPSWMNGLIFIFIAHQLIGLLFNPYSLVSNLQAIVVTCSHLIVFYSCASLNLSGEGFKRILSVWAITASWIAVIALNQKHQWLVTPSPLLPQREGRIDMFTSIAAGSFGNSELFSEYFCIVFLFSLIFIMHSKVLAPLRVKSIFPYIMLFTALACLMMGGSRAAILLAGAVMLFILGEHALRTNFFNRFNKLFFIGSAGALGVVFLLQFGTLFSLDKTIDDFAQLDLSRISLESIVSGDSINRDTTYELGFQRLGERSWWLGYGYNLPENNQESMGVTDSRYADFHSLYLSLPIYYGWVGAAAYVLLVLCTGLRSFLCYYRNRKSHHFLVPLMLGFAIVWGVFLLDQYKIGVTRNPSYFLLTWFWLGWTNSLVNTLQSYSRSAILSNRSTVLMASPNNKQTS